MPKKGSLNKKTLSVSEFCDSLIATNYYHNIRKTSKIECLRLVAKNIFDFKCIQGSKYKYKLNALANRCSLFFKDNEIEIEHFLSTLYNGPNLNIPAKFNLQYEYSEIFDVKKKSLIFNLNLRNNVYEKFRNINSLCILTDKRKKIKKTKPFLVLQFTCSFPNCPATYDFTLNNGDLIYYCNLNFSVEQSGRILHFKGVSKSNFINKDKRTELGMQLTAGKSADTLYYDILNKQSDDVVEKEDDIKHIVPSKETLRKIKHEMIKKTRLDKDRLFEVEKFRKLQLLENISYIREVSCTPMRIFMFHEKMFEVLKRETKIKKCLDLHLDCTGSLIEKFTDKQVFYYSIALPSMKDPSSSRKCPQISVFDAIMADHSTLSIKFWLENFLKLLDKKTHVTHQVRKVETDFSWAFLHASIEAFNKCDTKTYLQRSFEVATKAKKMSDFSFFTVFHLCASHIIKAVSNNLSKATTSKKIKKKFLYSFARLQNCTDINNAGEFYKHLVIVFMSEYQSDLFKNSLSKIDIQIDNPNLNLNFSNDVSQGENYNDFYTNFQTGICNGSPFNFYFEKVFFEAKTLISSTPVSNIRNCFYCPNIFVSSFLKKYLALFSLWSGVHLADTAKTRDTNSNVENWFRLIKHHMFKVDKRYRPKEFISKLYSELSTRIKERIIYLNKEITIINLNILPQGIHLQTIL